MRPHLTVGFIMLIGVLLLTTPSTAQTYSFASIDVPCGAAPPTNCPNGMSRRTAIGGINPAGDVVGTYTDGVGRQHGFLLSGGRFTTIDVPGSFVGAPGNLPSVARGIGPSGDIVGQFTAPYNPPLSTSVGFDSPAYCPSATPPQSAACTKGFLYSRGSFAVVLFPGHPGAIPGRILPDGSIYGCLHDFDTMGSMFSAAWTRLGDTSIAAGGGALFDPALSYPNSMHGGATPDGSVVTGFYIDMAVTPNHQHGYFLQNGVLQTYDVPNSTLTVVWDINPGREAVGTYVDQGGVQRGFVQWPDGSAPITIDVPSTAPFNSVLTIAMSINPAGVIAGQYKDSSGHTHGFVAMPATTN